MKLEEFFLQNKNAVLGFSGGVDSVYLMYAAQKYGARVIPCFIKTPFQPQFELDDAQRAAQQIGVTLRIIEYDILKCKNVAENSPVRCYHCKKEILSLLKTEAQEGQIPLIIDGTNASDKAEERPGTKALCEFGVRSPLKECGLTKNEIRRLSKEAGLFTYNKPSYSCLATRIATGDRIDKEALNKVENSENELFALGFSDFRVRVWHGAARLQFSENEQEQAFFKRKQITEKLKPCFDIILFDLKGR